MMISLSLFLGVALAAPIEELVPVMPGVAQMTFGLYSGHLPLADGAKSIHYLLAESQSDRTKDPLVIWFNGGPGCSSMLAFLQEHGPYLLDDGAVTFRENPYSWNNEANVLYIEQPAGVGYSTCNETLVDCSFNDTTDAEDNLQIVLAWFEKYPEYKEHDLYISGESYGGIYVPLLVDQIDTYNAAANATAFKP